MISKEKYKEALTALDCLYYISVPATAVSDKRFILKLYASFQDNGGVPNQGNDTYILAKF